MIIYRSRFPPRVSANSFGGYRHRRVPGKAASASRGRGNVLPCTGGPEGAGWDGRQRACTLVSNDSWPSCSLSCGLETRAEIRTKRVRKQKTDRQDAQLILRLLLEDRFPQIWVPSWENRDLRQLLWHRHRMVQARNRIMNQLQAVALNEGLRCKKRRRTTDRNSNPDILGMFRSEMITSGRNCLSFRRASNPSFAVATSYPSRCSNCPNTSRMHSSSSTTRMRNFRVQT
jgi:hypothetical protein